MDIYRELAAAILGKPAVNVTVGQRATAKQAFWTAFGAVAQLPGNEYLVPEGVARCNRCTGYPAPHLSSDICVVCAPVLLCQGCFDTHKQEIAGQAGLGLQHSHGLPPVGFDANNCGSC